MHKPGGIMKPVHMIASLFLLFTGIGVGVGASRLNSYNERRTKT
jgi:hypothetical protein